MCTFTTIAFAAATVFSTAAFAAPANVPSADSSVQIKGTAVRGVQMSENDFAGLAGEYQLANGKKLTVSNNNTRYFAQVDGQREVEIVATSSKSFMSTNTDMELKFGVHSNGIASNVVVGSRN